MLSNINHPDSLVNKPVQIYAEKNSTSFRNLDHEDFIELEINKFCNDQDSTNEDVVVFRREALLNIAIVLSAYEKTGAGYEWIKKNSIRSYTLINILRVASSDEAIIDILKVVLDCLLDKDNEYIYIQHLDLNKIKLACIFLIDNFSGVLDDVKFEINLKFRSELDAYFLRHEISDGAVIG